MKANELSEYAHFLQQQQQIESRLDSRLSQFNNYQAATLNEYNRASQIIQFADGGTRNSKSLSNSSQVIGGVLPLVTISPNGAFSQSR